MSKVAAYQRAGYSRNRFSAYQLHTKPHIQMRVKQLNERSLKGTGITKEFILNRLEEDRNFAREHANPSAAISATMGQAKIAGLIIDKKDHSGGLDNVFRVEHSNVLQIPDDMPIEQLDALEVALRASLPKPE
jgi:hypothetical protein